MKKNLVLLSIVVAFFFGFYLLNKTRLDHEKRDDRAPGSAMAVTQNNKDQMSPEDKNSIPTANAQLKKEQLKFETVGIFEIASPPVPKDEIIAEFGQGAVINGIVFKANYEVMKKNFETGSSFNVPVFNGGQIQVNPRKVIVNVDGTTIFVGEAETKDRNQQTDNSGASDQSNPDLSRASNEVNFVFVENRLVMGQVREKGQVYQVRTGLHGQYLIQYSPQMRFD